MSGTKRDMHRGFGLENLGERYYLEDLEVDGRTIENGSSRNRMRRLGLHLSGSG
jgi:hypothetical protein